MNFYDPTGRPKITVSRPAPQWAASTSGPYFDAMFSAPGGVHLDFLEDDVDRHEHRTKAMGPARRTTRRV